MKLLMFAEFTADFPDDSIEENGQIVREGGFAMTQAIVAMLRDRGMDVSEPAPYPEHGWEVFVKSGDHKAYILANDIGDEQFLSAEDMSPILTRLFKGKADHAAFLKLLHESLMADGRFHDIQWWDGMRKLHSPVPVVNG